MATPVTERRPKPVTEPSASPERSRLQRAGRALGTVPAELPVLTFLALVTRLVAVTYPRQTVFDEVYFREYALRYLDGSYYFDLHPPLGKLLLGGWAWLTGVTATAAGGDPAVGLRVLPALAGTALVPVFSVFLRELTASRKVATFAAAMLVMENAVLVESRFTLIDSMLLLFGIGAVTCYLASLRATTGRRRWMLTAAAAVLAGMAASTKWTGLTALGLIGLVWFVRTLRIRIGWRRSLPELAVLAAVPALVYSAVFAVHFALLPRSGPGDAYMSSQFQATLAGNAAYDPSAGMALPGKLLEINEAIHSYELSLNSTIHPYASTWLSWPLLQRPVYYWAGPINADGTQGHVYLQGNPVIWWGLLLGVAVVAVGWIRRPDLFAGAHASFGLLAVAWAINYLPFATITRPMFLYHYFFALLFCLAAVSLGIGRLAGWTIDGERPWAFPSRRSAAAYWGLLAVALAGFVFFLPISYGIPLTDAGLSDRMWLGSWR